MLVLAEAAPYSLSTPGNTPHHGCNPSAAQVEAALRALDPYERRLLAHLADMHCSLDECVVAVEMGTDPCSAQAWLEHMCRQRLLLPLSGQSYQVTALVQQLLQQINQEELIQSHELLDKSCQSFSAWVFAQMHTCGQESKGHKLKAALQQGSDHRSDIAAALACASERALCKSTVTKLASSCSEDLCRLLELLGILGRQECIQAFGNLADLLQPATPLLGMGADVDPSTAIRGFEQQHTERQTQRANALYCHGVACLSAGQYSVARTSLGESLDIRARLLGPQHPDTIHTTAALATCMQGTDQHAEAYALLKRCLDLSTQELGLEHPDTLTRMREVANCLQAQGQYSKALSIARQAQEFSRKVLGAQHPDTAACQHDVAVCYVLQGRAAKALPMLREAFQARAQVLGPQHPHTLRSMASLGTCLQAQGQYSKALPWYRHAQELCLQVLGPMHPHTIDVVNRMAHQLHAQGRDSEALPMLHQALESATQSLGLQHTQTLNAMSSIALCLGVQGRYTEALPLLRQVVHMRTMVLGGQHPATIESINNLGQCLQEVGQLAEARQLHQEALDFSRKVLGAQHPDTACIMASLGRCMQAQAQLPAAQAMLKEALQILTAQLTLQHPYTIASLHALAACLKASGKAAEALADHRQAWELSNLVLGDQHPCTVRYLCSLALCLYDTARFREAQPLLQQAVGPATELLGPQSEATVSVKHSLGALYLYCLAQPGEAEPLLKDALTGRHLALGEGHMLTCDARVALETCLRKLGQEEEEVQRVVQGCTAASGDANGAGAHQQGMAGMPQQPPSPSVTAASTLSGSGSASVSADGLDLMPPPHAGFQLPPAESHGASVLHQEVAGMSPASAPLHHTPLPRHHQHQEQHMMAVQGCPASGVCGSSGLSSSAGACHSVGTSSSLLPPPASSSSSPQSTCFEEDFLDLGMDLSLAVVGVGMMGMAAGMGLPNPVGPSARSATNMTLHPGLRQHALGTPGAGELSDLSRAADASETEGLDFQFPPDHDWNADEDLAMLLS